MRISPRLLRVDIYQKLREQILACDLKPGADLREQALAAHFSVSKSPVRDALLRLERERLIIIAPRQGYRVASISLSDARDLFRLRLVLETASVLESARAAEEADLEALDRFRGLPRRASREVFIVYNRDFHCALARLSGNARMAAGACDLIEQMDRLVRMSVEHIERRDPSTLLREHGLIIDALQARQGRKAAALLRGHIEAAGRRVRDALSRAAVLA